MKAILKSIGIVALTTLPMFAYTQTLEEISSPTGFDGISGGYQGEPIIMGDNMYVEYHDNSGSGVLFKYDGTSLEEVPTPSGYNDPNRGYNANYSVVIGNTLYMLYTQNNRNYDLFKYDGTNLDSIPSPPGYDGHNERGYTGQNVVMKDTLFMSYKNNTYNRALFKYDGTTLTEITTPAGYDGFYGFNRVTDSCIYMRYGNDNKNYDLFIYKNGSLDSIPSPPGYMGAYNGFGGITSIIGNTIYMLYEADDDTQSLFKYDGTNLTQIPNPTGYTDPSRGFTGTSVVMNDTLFVKYRKNDGTYDLFKYDGTNLTLIPSPGFNYTGSEKGWSNYKAFVHDDVIYFRYLSNSFTHHMVKYENGKLIEVPVTTLSFNSSHDGYSGADPVAYNGKLYCVFQDVTDAYFLCEYGGDSIRPIQFPTGYSNTTISGFATPFLFENALYIKVRTDEGHNELMYFENGSLHAIPNPDKFKGLSASGYQGYLIEYMGNLYMQYADTNYQRVLIKLTPCQDPTVSNLSATVESICVNNSSTISIDTASQLNSANQWVLYSGLCGANKLDSNTTGSFNVSPNSTTNYFVRGEGGCIDSAACESITITVLTSTSATVDTSINQGESFTIGSSTYTEAGNYIDTLTNSNNCDSIVTTNLTVVGGIASNFNGTISVYPNPTEGNVQLNITGAISNLSYKLYDLRGQLLETNLITKSTEVVELNNLPKSIYLLKIFEGGQEMDLIKIVKQ